jgi:pSer/pThr/pTyr-binding forkhead associated (FHA) protein
MPKLVVLNRGLHGFGCDLVVERTTIGRSVDNTFRIPDTSVSRHHAVVIQRGADVLVSDLGSSNGTFIEGQEVRPHTEVALKLGQIVRLGEVDLRLEAEEEAVAQGSVDATQIFRKT